MPFTLCHPALVVPLHRCVRRWTSLSALVIGSMAPDFVYFLPAGVDGVFSHSVPGLFLYCVPAAPSLRRMGAAGHRRPDAGGP